jgi:hypothetical protein
MILPRIHSAATLRPVASFSCPNQVGRSPRRETNQRRFSHVLGLPYNRSLAAERFGQIPILSRFLICLLVGI